MKNITLDFTANKSVEALTAGQPLAIMPADLAKRLLKMYAKELSSSTLAHIVERHCDNLRKGDSMDTVLQTSISFIQERDLIQNVIDGNWDAYAVPTEEEQLGTKVR